MAIKTPALASNVTQQETPKYGGTLIVQIANDPTVLSCYLPGRFDMTEFVDEQIFSRLFRQGDNYTIVPDLVKSWNVSSDGLSYNFNIYHNVTFSDGYPLTSADIKWSYDYALKNIVQIPQWSNVVSITTQGNYTIVFKLKALDVNFMYACMMDNYMFILPKHLYQGYENSTKFATNSYNMNPIGSGPFKFVDYVKEDHLTMVANDHYFKGRPYLDKLIFKVIPDATTAVLALETGEVQTLQISASPMTAKQLANNTKITILRIPSSTFWGLEFNLEDPILSNLKVREAFAYAINEDQINALAFDGGVLPAHDASFLAYLFSAWRSPNAAKFPFNVTKANQLLDSAGYPRGSDGVRFTKTVDYCAYMPGDSDMWLMIQQQLSVVGIKLILNQMDWATYYAKFQQMQAGTYQFQLNWCWGCCAPWTLERAYYSKGEINVGHYNNSKVDQLVLQARQTLNETKRMVLYKQLQDIASADLPRFPLYNLATITLWSSEYRGYEMQGRYPLTDIWWTKGQSVSPNSASQAITTAQTSLKDLQSKGWNVDAALAKLEQAKTALNAGQYVNASTLAKDAASLAEPPPVPYLLYGSVIAVVAIVIVAVWFFKFRKA